MHHFVYIMSVFNPELREERESFFEAKHFSPDFEKRLLKALHLQNV